MSDPRRATSALAAVVIAFLLAAWVSITTVAAANLVDLPVLRGSNGVLDILMVARPDTLPMGPFVATDWVYDICSRPMNGDLACPSSLPNLYGGTRLQLNQGDTLKVRLVNKLPPAPEAKHRAEPGMQYLGLNPTNLHTHGMLVSAHYPTINDKTYGDNVFVLTLNSANGRPAAGQHIHSDVRNDVTDYRIRIPKNHPSGLYWFHPHVHGISLNQISAGMAGVITVGHVGDYLCKAPCGLPAGSIPTRNLLLKDTEVGPPGILIDQQDPAYCDEDRAAGDPPRLGACLQAGLTGNGTDRGRWYFTVNGQQYPNAPVAAPTGQIWRITNASASITYNLGLRDTDHNNDLLMQVISIDGVSVNTQKRVPADVLNQIVGAALHPEHCPGSNLPETPLCVRRLVMFPSSRVEVWVTYRDSQGLPARPSGPVNAVFRNFGMTTGPIGDAWPKVDLASVVFRPDASARPAVAALTVSGEGQALMSPDALAKEHAAGNKAFAATIDCTPLAPGHMRRIFFNSIVDPGQIVVSRRTGEVEPPNAAFGLGYEEADENGNQVPGTYQYIAKFDPATPTVCVTLSPGNKPTYERWQLINLAGEDHNFHMHQTKFALLTRDETEGTVTPRNLLGHGVLHDNVPLQHADGCLTTEDWRLGKCTAHPVTVEIPFTVAGDYVYHCHILEHEDGGMMARIRVRAAP
jgi:FtsP/CotA-like multicopper oxidase with cupredoxin domain